jgi:hypothetical protein
MANILNGVNGEGSGHASRSREISSHLEGQGHSIHVVSFDRGLKNLADFSVTEISLDWVLHTHTIANGTGRPYSRICLQSGEPQTAC